MGSIKIEQVRDVIDRADYRPFEGRRRVVIIDEADALMDAAQNALLKTLEEPPSASMFVLVSSIPDALLPTVRSRCSRLRFAAIVHVGSDRGVAAGPRDIRSRMRAPSPSTPKAASAGRCRPSPPISSRRAKARSGCSITRLARATRRDGSMPRERGDRRRRARLSASAISWRRVCARSDRCSAT